MKKIVIGLLLLPMTGSLIANMGPQGFGQFKNDFFVETGTFGGDGIAKALSAGFKEIRSIESEVGHVRYARQRFSQDTNVYIFHGSSAEILWDVIQNISKPITFWLDAHIFPPVSGVKNCPLLEELEQIKRHPIKTHTILIDDMHCAGTAAFDFLTKEDLVKKILEINPDYTIRYVPGGDAGEYPVNVMVATVEK